MQRFLARDIGQTDRQTDGKIAALLNAPHPLLEERGSVAEWLACWTQAQKGPGFKSQPRRCPVTVLGKLFTSIVPLFTKQQNW